MWLQLITFWLTLLSSNYLLHTKGLSTTWLKSLNSQTETTYCKALAQIHNEENNTLVLAYADVSLSSSSEALKHILASML